MRYSFIEVEKAHFPVLVLCRTLQVSASGYYAWRDRPESLRRQADRRLLTAIRAVHKASRGTYGSPRVHAELRQHGHGVGRHRVARLMREDALRARRRRRFRKTTQSNHTHPVAPNLLERRFDVGAPNRAWVSDLSYVWTLEGWLYLCVILDLFSRRVIGWSMDSRIDRHLTLSALRMALANREVSSGLVHHSDRGSQYAAGDYRKVLRAHGLECSMSRKGDCWDNAVVESFFATLKVELIYRSAFATRKEARQAIFDYIEAFYNRRRRHSYLGFLSPVDFEGRGTKSTLAA